jgi:hypothetical protein
MKRITQLLILFILTACGQTEDTSSDRLSKEKVIYVETKNFGIDLQSCFSNTLFNKWSDTSFILQDSKITYKGKDLNNKHVFLDINSLTQTNTQNVVEKILVILKGDWTVQNTTFTIEKFALQTDGQWKNIGSYEALKLFDRGNDFISPKELDVDEICEQVVKKIVEASYK